MASRQVGVTIDSDVFDELRERADARGVSVSALARELLTRGLQIGTPGSMSEAVDRALERAGDEPRDGATRELARKYAALIDAAALPGRYRRPLEKLYIVVESYESVTDDYIDAYNKVSDALSETSIASDLGPKLLAALTALELAPAARRDPKGGSPDAPKSRGGSALGKLRNDVEAQRAKRERRAGSA